jgi:hypothetical protein
MHPIFTGAIILAALAPSIGASLAADTTRYKPQTVRPAPPSTYKPKLERPAAAAAYRPQLNRPGQTPQKPQQPPVYRPGGPTYSVSR